MMGKDIENLLLSLEHVKDAISVLDTNVYSYYVGYYGEIIGDDYFKTEWNSTVVPVAHNAIDLISKLLSMESKMFGSINEFNNSLGSPWNEFKKFQSLYSTINTMISCRPTYIDGWEGILAKIATWYSSIIDCKWALTYYNDYVQRGYDNLYNGNKPSIVIKRNKNKETTGNINQSIDNNVAIPEPSIDPY